MSIDPTKFEAQGLPTKEQARTVWDAHPKPSARKVTDLLVKRGFSIGWRTIARWKANGWREELPSSGGGTPTLAEQGKVRGVTKELKAALREIPAETVAEADKLAADGGLDAAMSGGKLTDADYDRIEKRIKALSPETKEKLLEIQERSRLVMNIVMMEEATRRAHVMVLIPKDTGSFIVDTNDAAGQMASVAPIEAIPPGPGNGDDARVIEGKVNQPSALSMTLRKLRENAA